MTRRIDAVLPFEMSHAVHHPDMRAVHTCAMAQHDDFNRQAWLDALNALVQMGLVEVVSIVEDGEPSYSLRRGFATCESSQLIPSPYPGPGQSLTRETIFHVRKQRTGDGGRSFREVYVPADFLGFDHADVRVASLAAVEAFYDALMPELGLPEKSYGYVDPDGNWHAPTDEHPYNTVEYHETLVPGEPEHFIGFTEDRAMAATATRIAFRVATVADVERLRERVRELGAPAIEVDDDFAAYPAVFFRDPGGTALEICARRPKS